ncbi:MAG TPA: serine hydrolase, partial [Gillisia sp.]|nr:serine hydrolase [Gillisia sp.]
ASEKGNFAIAFRDLSSSNFELFRNEHENFHAASTMKTPVMIEVYRQAKEGKFRLEDSLVIKNEFKSILDGSSFSLDITRDGGEKLYEHIGEKTSIESLVRDMIIHSSNLATNIVIELVGAQNVNKTMRALGAVNINVLRGVEDMKAYDAGMNNSVTAYDLMVIFDHLGRGTAVDPRADKEMINILFDQNHREIIPALLPPNIKIANKTGMITGVHHDSALVFFPGGRKYVLVLLSKNMEDMDAGTQMLAKVSKLVYDFMEGK